MLQNYYTNVNKLLTNREMLQNCYKKATENYAKLHFENQSVIPIKPVVEGFFNLKLHITFIFLFFL